MDFEALIKTARVKPCVADDLRKCAGPTPAATDAALKEAGLPSRAMRSAVANMATIPGIESVTISSGGQSVKLTHETGKKIRKMLREEVA